MDTAYLKRVLLSVLSVLLIAAILVYLLYHVSNGFSPEVRTAQVVSGEYRISTEAVGTVFRYEKPIDSRYGGAVNYLTGNGEKVNVNAGVAQVYESGSDLTLTEKLLKIDERISLLERSSFADGVNVTNTDAIDERILAVRGEILSCKRSGNIAALNAYSDELLILLNRRELVVQGKKDYSEQAQRLRAERERLSAGFSGAHEDVTVAQSGYFYYECDGYEEICDPVLLETMTPSEFDALMEKTPDSRSAVGKLVLSQTWYLALTVDRVDMSDYIVGQSYEIAYPDYGDLTIPMMLSYAKAGGESALLVFSTGRMVSDFRYERQQSVRIIRESCEGLRFPASAVRINDGVEGVYALLGNTVVYRTVEPLGIEDGYVYVKKDGASHVVKEADPGMDNGITWMPVMLYDQVIVAGTDLYHGQILN